MIQFERLGQVLIPDKEYQSKFNAGMIKADGEIHMLYRFSEKSEKWRGRPIDWLSIDGVFPYVKDYICYARLNKDGSLRYDTDTPVIYPELPYETIGCEDPRIVAFEGAYYVFYCGLSPDPVTRFSMRIAIAKTTNFMSYEKLGAISHFTFDKDAFIFPERINGKIALMHRVAPDIQINFFESFEEMLLPDSWKDYEKRLPESVAIKGEAGFERKKIGGGVPPIKTDKGWLIIYHGVDEAMKYHAAAALLDRDDPFTIISRIPYPVMSPETEYETSGDYMGCVFPQGYFIQDGDLYISYGTADKYTAIAKTDLAALIAELERYSV